MRSIKFTARFAALLLAGCATGTPVGPLQPSELGVDESLFDEHVSACDDFYTYACGGWLAKTEIPSDRPSWGRGFSEVEERNEALLHTILDDAAAGKPSPDPYGPEIGALYGSCMDEARAESTTPAALAALTARIGQVTTLDALARYVAESHLSGNKVLFGFSSTQDLKDASRVVADLSQGGLSLPDRDYYLKDDGKFPELRQKYLAHVEATFLLAGLPAVEAKRRAGVVMAIEKRLAEAGLSLVQRREPKNLYHRLELDGIEKAAPHFPWKAYLTALGYGGIREINVQHPPYLSTVESMMTDVPLKDWQIYLHWHALRHLSDALSKPFVDQDFAFYKKTLEGTDQNLPRWKRCLGVTDHLLGEALARPFVRRAFGEDAKRDAKALVVGVEAAMERNLSSLPWMDAATRTAAVGKLHTINQKIGFPDRWRNYDGIGVKKDASFVDNAVAGLKFATRRDLSKIGKPVDHNEWGMTPPTVNAYYEPSLNEMVFPAGILQKPFYARGVAPAVNYGAIGMVVGHELTHGFDDEGRQFDAKGNLRDWWSPSVNAEFEKRTQCIKKQYDGYTVLDNLHLDGKLTMGENIADLGGMKLAYAAYRAARPKVETYNGVKGKLTDSQLFFLGYAQSWCTKRRDETTRMRVTTDPHSPPQYRINGVVSNLPEFADAFQCKAGSPMVRGAEACTIW